MPDAPTTFRYKRVLLKVSGEVLMGDQSFGVDMKTVDTVAKAVADVAAEGIEICLVIGGGNIFRGLSKAAAGMERAQADYMGMLATIMNALAMQSALEKIGVSTRVQSAIPMAAIAEPAPPACRCRKAWFRPTSTTPSRRASAASACWWPWKAKATRPPCANWAARSPCTSPPPRRCR